MSSKRLKRIVNEIKELQESKQILEQSGIYFHYDEDDMSKIYALLVGPENTPYEKGFYFFKFEYPPSYPMEPPKATYCTQGALPIPTKNNEASKSTVNNVRFNPNLYVCGKVCLSMLNTWNGPGWVPTNTITNVMVAIQALVLNEEPLRNEPGFENSDTSIIKKYNEVIEYANIKISVINMVSICPNEFLPFKPIVEELFIKYIPFYHNFILTKNDVINNKLIESPAYGMKTIANYTNLFEEINTLEEIVLNNITNDTIEKMEKMETK